MADFDKKSMIVPKKIQWIVLLIASIYFYISTSVQYIIYVLLAAFFTYLGSLWMSKLDRKNKEHFERRKDILTKETEKALKKELQKKKKIIITITTICTLSMLIVIKYTDFLFSNISLIYGFINSSTLHKYG